MINLLLASISVLLLNIPFGYWRKHVRKFSWSWFFAVHIPVPFVVLIRYSFQLGFQLYTYPFLVASFFFGQYTGGKIYQFRNKHYLNPLTGCLIMDLYRQIIL